MDVRIDARAIGRQAAVLALGLGAGLGIAYVAFADQDTPSSARALTAVDERPGATLPPVRTTATPPPPAGQPAGDPRSAVAGFLQAEADGDFRASWGLLGVEDRATYGTVERWIAAHEAFAPIIGFELDADAAGARADAADTDPAHVDALLHLRPGLDGVLGLVAARATSTWVAIAEDGGWRVAFGRASMTPVALDDADAPAAAVSWAEARRRCDDDAPEHGTLVGTTGLADRLCGTDSPATADGPPGHLPAVDATRFVSAYGPDAAAWARVVALRSAVPLRAVLAPIDDRWVVVGVLPPSS